MTKTQIIYDEAGAPAFVVIPYTRFRAIAPDAAEVALSDEALFDRAMTEKDHGAAVPREVMVRLVGGAPPQGLPRMARYDPGGSCRKDRCLGRICQPSGARRARPVAQSHRRRRDSPWYCARPFGLIGIAASPGVSVGPFDKRRSASRLEGRKRAIVPKPTPANITPSSASRKLCFSVSSPRIFGPQAVRRGVRCGAT